MQDNQEELPKLHEYSMKFMGGSVTLSPAKTFQGRGGTNVELPDRIVLKVEGKTMTLTASSIDAMAKLSTLDRAKPFLDRLRAAENDDQDS